MSDEEIEKCEGKDQESVTHDRYRAAVNHPDRKAILEVLRERSLTVEELAAKTGLTAEALSWHLAVLESGRFACVEKENRPDGVAYRLTKAGRVINYLE
jgi:Bacterial regulatory protein, arsR family.